MGRCARPPRKNGKARFQKERRTCPDTLLRKVRLLRWKTARKRVVFQFFYYCEDLQAERTPPVKVLSADRDSWDRFSGQCRQADPAGQTVQPFGMNAAKCIKKPWLPLSFGMMRSEWKITASGISPWSAQRRAAAEGKKRADRIPHRTAARTKRNRSTSRTPSRLTHGFWRWIRGIFCWTFR